MSDPRRILEGPDATQFERDLLESWSSEQPSAAARARALAIAGAAAGTLAAAAAATAGASSSGLGAAAGVAAPKAAGLGLMVTLKWGFLFAVVAASGVASVVLLGKGRTDEVAAPVAPVAHVASVAKGVAASPTPALPGTASPTATANANANANEAPALEPKTVSPADLPPAAAVPTATATTAVGPAPRAHAAAGATGDSSLSEEIAAFDKARGALDAGDADRALALVDAYEKRFPAGTFVQEAEVLRVQALTRKGDAAGARRVGQRFLAAHPTSPHAARIRAILDASNP